jgi:hypothetical protein
MEKILSIIFDNIFFVIMIIFLLRFFQKAKGTGKLSGTKFKKFISTIEELNEQGQKQPHKVKDFSELKKAFQSNKISSNSINVHNNKTGQDVEMPPGIKILIVLLVLTILYFIILK